VSRKSVRVIVSVIAIVVVGGPGVRDESGPIMMIPGIDEQEVYPLPVCLGAQVGEERVEVASVGRVVLVE